MAFNFTHYTTGLTDKKLAYEMAKSADAIMIQKVEDNTEIEIAEFGLFIKESDGEQLELLSLMDNNGQIYVTQSATFTDEFFDIANYFLEFHAEGEILVYKIPEGSKLKIKKLSGKSKAGRSFVTCAIA